MAVVDDLRALLLFNEKAAELRNSRFIAMAAHPSTGINISAGIDIPFTVTRIGPDDESLKAFMLTFRFFVQKNEPCSFHNIAAIYGRLDVQEERKTLVERARTDLNTFLDMPTFIAIGDDKNRLSNRRILEVFLYGSLAHSNDEKRRVLESWRAIPQMWLIVYNELVNVVSSCLPIIFWLQTTNAQTLEELKSVLPKPASYTRPLS